MNNIGLTRYNDIVRDLDIYGIIIPPKKYGESIKKSKKNKKGRNHK